MGYFPEWVMSNWVKNEGGYQGREGRNSIQVEETMVLAEEEGECDALQNFQ